MKNKKKAEGVYVKLDSEYINIQDLSQEDYESFLEGMEQLRLTYWIMVRQQQPPKKTEKEALNMMMEVLEKKT